MRNNHLFLFVLASLFFTFTSCSKEQKKSAAAKNDTANAAVKSGTITPKACIFGMMGFYASSNNETDTAYFDEFISNQIAHMGNSPYSSPFWSSIKTWTSPGQQPYCFILGDNIGDTLTFNVRLKNPSFGPGSVTAWDVSLNMIGTQGTGGVCFVGNTQFQQFTYLRAGSTSIINNANLVSTFDVWTELKLVAVKLPNSVMHALRIYKNNGLLLSLNYDPATSGIGKIKQFEISFKGAGSVDWFRVSSSNSGNLRLTNEFEPEDEFDNGLRWHYN